VFFDILSEVALISEMTECDINHFLSIECPDLVSNPSV